MARATNMIRLTTTGDESAWRDVERRLRGAAVTRCCELLTISVHPADCDALCVLDPPFPEPVLIEHWLAEGKHVLLAADGCRVRTQLERFARRNEAGGPRLVLVNPDRWLPSRRLIRQQLDAGKLGATGLVRIHRWEPAPAARSTAYDGLPAPLLRDIDLALWLAGGATQVVYATAPSAPAGEPAGWLIQMHLGFAGGEMALIDYAATLPAGEGYAALSLIGAAGAAYADDHQNMQLHYGGGRPAAVRAEEGISQRAGLVQAFVDSIAANDGMADGVTEWRAVLEVAEAVEKSLTSQQAVALAKSESG